jgi:NADH-quinone oxidoreductase subunit E
MFFMAVQDPGRWMPRSGENIFEYWASLTPAAPLFGQTWRFADVVTLEVEPGRASESAALALSSIPAEPQPVTVPAEASEAVAAPGLAETMAAAALDEGDDLTLIKGIGPKLAAELNRLGVFSLAQVASMTEDDLVRIDEGLTSFKGRSVRDDWVGQARALLGL